MRGTKKALRGTAKIPSLSWMGKCGTKRKRKHHLQGTGRPDGKIRDIISSSIHPESL